MSRTGGWRVLLPALVAALLGGAASVAHAQFEVQEPSGSWSLRSGNFNEFWDFYHGGSTTDGSYLYTVGGWQYNFQGSFPDDNCRLRRYDPASNTWISLASMSAPRIYTTAATAGGRIFVFGGYDPSAGASDVIQAYTISANAWVTLESTLTQPRYDLAAATLGDRIYIAGGRSDDFEAFATTDEFNPADDSVTEIASMPAPLYGHTLTSVDSMNRLYAIGGHDEKNYEYSPDTESWTPRTIIMQPGLGIMGWNYAVSICLNDRIYVVGGIRWNQTLSMAVEYTPSTDSWVARASMNRGRFGYGGAAINGKAYVYGGLDLSRTGEEFTPPFYDPAPVANAGPDETIECAGQEGSSYSLDATGSSDAGGDALTYSWVGPFGSAEGATPMVTLPLGSNEITLTVEDPSGQSSSDTVVITVVDTQAPVIASAAPSLEALWPPNGSMIDIEVIVSAGDVCDPAPVSEIISVSSNQVVGDEPDWEVTGALTLKLRAKRSGGDDRVYTITVRCTDESGNSTTAQATVTVSHN